METILTFYLGMYDEGKDEGKDACLVLVAVLCCEPVLCGAAPGLSCLRNQALLLMSAAEVVAVYLCSAC